MPRIPAICNTCGHTWQPHGIRIESGTDIRIHGGTVDGCPKCGGIARMISGTYEIDAATEDTPAVMRAMVDSPVDAAALRRYADQLRQLREKGTDSAEEVRRVFADAPSDLRRAVDWALKNKGTVMAAISIIITLLAFLEQRHGNRLMGEQLELQREQLRRTPGVTEPSTPGAATEPLTSPPASTLISVPKKLQPGRPSLNQPCPCGRAEKFKKCCEPTWPDLKPPPTPPAGAPPSSPGGPTAAP